MTKDYTTVRVEKAAKSVADDAKDDDETWSDYIRRCADADASVQRLVDADALIAQLNEGVVDIDTPDGTEVTPEYVTKLRRDLLDRMNELADDEDADASVSLDASERRAIAEEVAEVLR